MDDSQPELQSIVSAHNGAQNDEGNRVDEQPEGETARRQSRLGQRARRGNASAEERGEEESEDEAGEGPEADVEGERKRTWRENDYYCYSAGLRIAPKRFCSAGFGIAPKSGVIGVSWHKVHCQWQVKVKVFGKYKCAHVTPKDDSPQEIERSRVAAVEKRKAMERQYSIVSRPSGES